VGKCLDGMLECKRGAQLVEIETDKIGNKKEI